MSRRSFWILAALAIASLASAEESATTPARVLSARVGRSERGVPRVILETDRPVQFLTVESAEGNGFEVILLGTDTTSVPAANTAGDPVVRSLEFRTGPSGLIARVTLGDESRSGRAFALENPPRVVLDLAVKGDVQDVAPAPAEPKPVTKETPKEPVPAKSAAPKPRLSAPSVTPPAVTTRLDTSSPAETARDTSHTAPDAPTESAAAIADSSSPAATEKALGEVVAWVHELKAVVESIRKSQDGSSRAQARRELATLLRERGLYVESEKALLGAAAAAPDDTTAALRDSLDVAEMRLARGDVPGALAVANALNATRVPMPDRVRMARVLLDGDQPDLAETVLQPALAELEGGPKAHASLLMARSHWDRSEPAKALPYTVDLVASASTPEDVFSRAIILEADCLCALDRAKEAKGLYERASKLTLTPDEASWAWLQRGNLARREGRLDEAKECYETTKQRWPESFYASQADWFLRFDERLRALREEGAGKNRG